MLTVKILLDTDLGSNIDDAVALAYLLAQPEVDLLSGTTVSGQSHLRAQIVDALCQAAGCDVPILPGVEAPLLLENRQPLAQQALQLADWPQRTSFTRRSTAMPPPASWEGRTLIPAQNGSPTRSL